MSLNMSGVGWSPEFLFLELTHLKKEQQYLDSAKIVGAAINIGAQRPVRKVLWSSLFDCFWTLFNGKFGFCCGGREFQDQSRSF